MRLLLIAACIGAALSACGRTPAYPEAPSDRASVRIPLGELKEGGPVFHTFYAEGRKGINYFVLKEGDAVSSYFDACARCYPRKLGYRRERGRVVCRTCDVGYERHDLKDGVGSCYPISLAGSVDGVVYVIRIEDILKGGRYF
ncbi:MAG: Fe-S-containing protein [Nitrospiraceae bacterium]|nr:Fe-S-containing protein [Nitrospiraceae bacterium]